MSEPLILSDSVDGIRTLTLDRPAKRNAFTHGMCEQLREAFLDFEASSDRVLILAANGTVFTAGADLNDPPNRFWEAVPGVGISVNKPMIAALEGPVVGMGVALLAYFDLCVAGEKAALIYPEAKVGVAAGLMSAITGRIPHKIALELMLLGDPIPAQRAYEVGFFNRLTPAGEALATARQLAATMANNAPLVMSFLKQMVNDTMPRSPVEAMYRTQQRAEVVSRSADAGEGLRAFQEKRQPNFSGK